VTEEPVYALIGCTDCLRNQ